MNNYEKTVYACKTDWEFEMGSASDLEGKMPLWSSLKALKRDKPCWRACGIVLLKITEVDVIEEPKRKRRVGKLL